MAVNSALRSVGSIHVEDLLTNEGTALGFHDDGGIRHSTHRDSAPYNIVHLPVIPPPYNIVHRDSAPYNIIHRDSAPYNIVHLTVTQPLITSSTWP